MGFIYYNRSKYTDWRILFSVSEVDVRMRDDHSFSAPTYNFDKWNGLYTATGKEL